MAITNLTQLVDLLKSKEKKRLVVSYANDAHSIEAVYKAVEMGIIEATLVGDQEVIAGICEKKGLDASRFKMVQESDPQQAAQTAALLVGQGKGDALMKGLVSTDVFMRSLLNKENGLMKKGDVLSHVTVLENPHYHKLLVVGDVAIIPQPDLKQKVAIANYLIHTARRLQIETPKLAVISASEQVLEAMPSSVEASVLAKMADRGQIKNAIVDGPLALDLAVSKEAAAIKKMDSPVAGDADCLLFPNIEAGNVFYKTNTKLAGATLGAMVAGAKVPAVLSSRGDSVEVKLNSIALAALTA